MRTSADVTVLWGSTPIALAHVPEGCAVAVSDDGVVVRAPGGRAPPGSVVVRVHPSGAAVGARRSVLPPGTEAQIPLTERLVSIYRCGAWQGELLTLSVAVTAGDPPWARRRPLALAAWLADACSAVAHAAVLAIAAVTMPPATAAPSFDDIPLLIARAATSDVTPCEPDEETAGAEPQLCAETAVQRIVGRSITVQGAPDNPDPHVARRHAVAPNRRELDLVDPLHGVGAGDPFALIMPWGRDDSLGNDPYSMMGALPGLRTEVAACFDDIGRWSCSDDRAEPATRPRLELSGIGDTPAPAPGRWMQRRRARAFVGPIAVSANVPRWVVAAAVRSAVEGARVCYERALLDAPALTGRLDVVLRVRGYEATVALAPSGEVAGATALRCCVESVHEQIPQDLPTGTRAQALYSIAFGPSGG